MRHALLLLFFASCLAAQSLSTAQATVPDDPVVQQLLLKADEALAQQDLNRALAHWQDILDRLGSKVIQVTKGERSQHPTDPTVAGDLFRGVRGHVMERLRQLNAEQFAVYVQKMEPKARELLQRGIAAFDEAALRDAASRWLLTPSGQAAAFTLLDLLLEQGRFDEALLQAQRLEVDLRTFGASVATQLNATARMALALRGLGRRAALEELVVRFSGAEQAQALQVLGKSLPAADWFLSLSQELPPSAPTATIAFPPLDVVRRRMWATEYQRNNEARELFVFDEREVNARVGWFPVMPSVQGASVYWSDGLTLTCGSMFTGTELWPAVHGPQNRHAGRRNRNLLFRVVVDGDLAVASLEGPPSSKAQRAWQGFETIEAIPNRKLVAVDSATGVQRWSHHTPGEMPREDRDFLRRLSIVQPPVARGNTFYATGTVLLGVFHHWALAINRNTGALLWRTYLGAGQLELNMFGNPVKEAVPLPLTEADGVLYCCTNMGVFCAVDALTGTLLWASTYAQEGIPGTDSPVTYERHPGWVPAAPVVHGSRVYAAPLDALTVVAFERDNGKVQAFPATRRTLANPNTWFLGLHRGALLVAGNVISAVDPDSGALRWRSVEIPARSGRAVFEGFPSVVGDSVWAAIADPRTRGSAIHRYALDGGALLEQNEARDQSLLGNLVVTPEALIIASEDSVAVCFDREEVEARLMREARSAGASSATHLRLGELLSRKPDHIGAIAAFEAALAAAERSADAAARAAAKHALFEAWLNAATARRDLPTGITPEVCFERALGHATDARAKARVLLAALDAALRDQNHQAAIQQCDAILASVADEPATPLGRLVELLGRDSPDVAVPAGLLAALAAARVTETAGDTRMAARRWQNVRERYGRQFLNGETVRSVASRALQALLTLAGRAAYTEVEEQAQKRFAAASAAQDEQGLRTVVENWPESAVALEAHAALVKLLIQHGKSVEAVLELQHQFRDRGNAPVAQVALYAELLGSLELPDSAREVAQRLACFGNADVGGRSATQAAQPFLTPAAPVSTASGIVPDNLQTAWRYGSAAADTPAAVLIPAGAPLPAHMVLGYVDESLVALNVEDGSVLWARPMQELQSPLHAADGRLLLHHDGLLACLDLRSGRELWRAVGEQFQFLAAATHEGLVLALARTLDRGAALRLLSYDWISGQLVHSVPASDVDRGGLQFNAGMVLVITDGPEGSRVFDVLSLAPVGGAAPSTHESAAPFLSNAGLLITFTSERQRTAAALTIRAKDPHTGAEIWKHEPGSGHCATTGSDGRYLAYQFSPARGSQGRRLTVLDLKDGTSCVSAALERNEIVVGASVFVGQRMYQPQRLVFTAGTGLAERVKAYDLDTGASPWSSADFTGPNLSLRVLPLADVVLLRKSVAGGRGLRTPASTLYGIDPISGAVTGVTELGSIANWSQDVGLTACGRTLVATAGAQLIALRAP
ncbi:MAG: hypothetical protein EXS14_02170 [Planctomycetes bacterium]|nr:hypothetical protein [Planctomycetota bacterium]